MHMGGSRFEARMRHKVIDIYRGFPHHLRYHHATRLSIGHSLKIRCVACNCFKPESWLNNI